jgi:site-specific DNA-cytosine methylase
MNRQIKLVELCSGVGCALIAMNYAGITNITSFFSEIDAKAIKTYLKNYPDGIPLGRVENVTGSSLGYVDVVTVSSPCQDLSEAGKKNGLCTTCGIPVRTFDRYMELKKMGYKFRPSCVFWECIRVVRELQEINPNLLFLFENVVSPEWEPIMSKAIGVEPYRYNSSELTAQNRYRDYWSNIPRTDVEDRKVLVVNAGDVIDGAVSGGGYRGVLKPDSYLYPKGQKYDQKFTARKDRRYNKDYKFNCITATTPPLKNPERRPGTCFYVDSLDNRFELTITQLEKIQTYPEGHTDVEGLSDRDRQKLVGNGWTPYVISELYFKNILTALQEIEEELTLNNF